MKKILTILLVLIGLVPYLFLATSVKKQENSKKEYTCITSTPYQYKSILEFGKVYYDMMFMNKNIILPYFFINESIIDANCDKIILVIGHAPMLKSGEKLKVYTDIYIINFFGIEIAKEESISMFLTY